MNCLLETKTEPDDNSLLEQQLDTPLNPYECINENKSLDGKRNLYQAIIKSNGTSEKMMNTSLSSNGMSSFDIRSMVFTSSNNGEDLSEGSPDQLLATAYSEAVKIGID
jgi:hypothetical protein